jgi:Family of unknown function (DUF6159)
VASRAPSSSIQRSVTEPRDATGDGRLRRSWRLTRTAFGLIRSDGALFALAAISAVATTAATLALFDLGGYFDHPVHTGGHFAVVVLIAAWPLAFIGTFFNVAIAAAAAARLDDRRLTARDALAVSLRRLPQIVLWSALATGVGLLLREIASRLPAGGRLAAWILGAAWEVVTLFAVPVIALEGCTAVGCVRRAAELFKQRWGEGLGGTVVITAVFALVSVPAALAAGIGGAMWRDNPATATALIIAAFGLLMLISSIANAVRQVFATALYRYATTAEAAGGFRRDDLERPFTRKRRGLFSRRKR